MVALSPWACVSAWQRSSTSPVTQRPGGGVLQCGPREELPDREGADLAKALGARAEPDPGSFQIEAFERESLMPALGAPGGPEAVQEELFRSLARVKWRHPTR